MGYLATQHVRHCGRCTKGANVSNVHRVIRRSRIVPR